MTSLSEGNGKVKGMDKLEKKNIFRRIRARMEDKDINVSLIATSIVVNTITATFKLSFGFYLANLWVIMHAIYFVVMAIVRYRTMKQYIYCKTIIDPVKRYDLEFDIHNKSGKFSFLIGLTYLALCARMFIVGDVVLIGGLLCYLFLVTTLIKISFAVYGLVATRSKQNPVIRVMKVIGMIDASLSVVPTLYTTLSYFGYNKAAEVSSVLGIMTSIGVMVSGIIMANRRKDHYLERYILSVLENDQSCEQVYAE